MLFPSCFVHYQTLLQQLYFLLEQQQTGISAASLKIRSLNSFTNSTINDSTIILVCSMPVCVLVFKSLHDFQDLMCHVCYYQLGCLDKARTNLCNSGLWSSKQETVRSHGMITT